MSNNEKFNALLNSCSDPRRMYNALLALAEAGFTRDKLRQLNNEELFQQKNGSDTT